LQCQKAWGDHIKSLYARQPSARRRLFQLSFFVKTVDVGSD
jgi:hypothetical protein